MISNKLKRIFASNGVQVLLCVFMLLFVFDVAYADIFPDLEIVEDQKEESVGDNGGSVGGSVGGSGDTGGGSGGGEGGKTNKFNIRTIIGVIIVVVVSSSIILLIKNHKRNPRKYCQDCGAPLDYNGKCPNPNCLGNQPPPPPPPKCNICGSNLGTNSKCTNPNCPSNIRRCEICYYQLYANGECSNPNCPEKSRICEFCNKIITEAHKQDQLCPSNWINPIKLDKGKILIKREPNAQGGQGHIHPVWVKDSPIEWLYKNFASNKIFELERQTLLDLNKEGIDFVPIYYREHEKGFIMSKADGDNLNNVFGLKGTKETKQIEKVKIIRFIKKLCDAIEKLHLKGISHRDLKPVNIFYDLGKEKITIIDFGSVAKKEKGNSNSKAPFGDDYKCGKDEGVDFESGKQRDIYAVGIIIKEIWEKSLLEDKQEIYDILYKTTCDNQKERINITELINLIESKWGALK